MKPNRTIRGVVGDELVTVSAACGGSGLSRYRLLKAAAEVGILINFLPRGRRLVMHLKASDVPALVAYWKEVHLDRPTSLSGEAPK